MQHLSKMYRKLLSNNLSIVLNIKILLITFCQESPQMLCAKFRWNWWNRLGGVQKSRFATFREFAGKKTVGRMGVAYYKFECGYSKFSVNDIRFLNVRQSICELRAKTHFPWLVVEIEDDNRSWHFLVTYIPSLVSFVACSGGEKCDHLGWKSRHSKHNRDLAGRDLLGP